MQKNIFLKARFNKSRIQMLILAHFHPAAHLFERYLLAVHQNTDSVNLSRKQFLPYRYSERDAHHHHYRGCEREERHPESKRTFRIVGAIEAGIEREHHNHHHRKHQLLRILLVVDCRAESGKYRGIKQIAAYEIQHEKHYYLKLRRLPSPAYPFLPSSGFLQSMSLRRTGPQEAVPR